MTAIFIYVLDPATAPTVEGTVRDASTNAPIAANIAIGPDFHTTSDGGTGFYQTQVISGRYNLTASADNYASQTFTDIDLNDMATVQQDFDLTPICVAFEDDVEGGNIGWNGQSPWAISAEAAHSPGNAWSDSPGGNYGNNLDTSDLRCEARYDDAVFRSTNQIRQTFDHFSIRRRIALFFGVSRIGHYEQRAVLANVSQHTKIRWLPDYGSVVDLEVTGVNYHSGRCVDSNSH